MKWNHKRESIKCSHNCIHYNYIMTLSQLWVHFLYLLLKIKTLLLQGFGTTFNLSRWLLTSYFALALPWKLVISVLLACSFYVWNCHSLVVPFKFLLRIIFHVPKFLTNIAPLSTSRYWKIKWQKKYVFKNLKKTLKGRILYHLFNCCALLSSSLECHCVEQEISLWP